MEQSFQQNSISFTVHAHTHKYKMLKRKISVESSHRPFMGFDHLALSICEFLSGNFLEIYSMRKLLLCKKPEVLSHSHFAHWEKNPAPRNKKQQNHSSIFQLWYIQIIWAAVKKSLILGALPDQLNQNFLGMEARPCWFWNTT